MSKKVFIIRGIPGAGKSTYVSNLAKSQGYEQLCVVSADDYFMVNVRKTNPRTGKPYHVREYVYNPSKIAFAHSECMRGFMNLLMTGAEAIAVDNTNIHRWEYQNYEMAAHLAKYEVEVVEVMPSSVQELMVCAARNVHRVPPEIVGKMAMEFEHDERATVASFSL